MKGPPTHLVVICQRSSFTRYMVPFLSIIENGRFIRIQYIREFPDIRTGKPPTIPREPISGKEVACFPANDLRKRISAACYSVDRNQNHSKARICCLCGLSGLSDSKGDPKFWDTHIWTQCPRSSDLVALATVLEEGRWVSGGEMMSILSQLDCFL